jgi:dihydropteroate synthase
MTRAVGPQPAQPAGLPPSLMGLERTLVMGVLNVTPDSFSDGGRWLDSRAAVDQGLALAAAGADIVDVGGESSRPGAHRVPAEEELRRVIAVTGELAAAGLVLSIDTSRAVVAEAAIAAGATLVNDVSGGLADPDMAPLLAELAVPFVAMHWRGPSAVMEQFATYGEVVTEVCTELDRRLQALVGAGLEPERIVLDPGLGFAKDAQHNWQLLAGIDQLLALGQPLLVGASRKRFLGALLGGPNELPRPPLGLDAATAAVTVVAAQAGAWCVRVHDVGPSADAVRVAAAVAGAATTPPESA